MQKSFFKRDYAIWVHSCQLYHDNEWKQKAKPLRLVYQLLSHSIKNRRCPTEQLMRKLVYEMTIGQRFLAGPLSHSVKSIEVLSILRFDRSEISVICKVVFENPRLATNRIFDDEVAETQELEKDRNGVCTFFVKRKLPDPPKGINPRLVYLSTPWKIEGGIGRTACLGSARQIKAMMRALEKAGIIYKVISLTNARFSRDSLIGILTDRQREILNAAVKDGYYDIPRKIRSDALATKLGMSNATFVAHRRKAEKRLLLEIFNSPLASVQADAKKPA